MDFKDGSGSELSLSLPLANAKNRQLQQKVRDKRNRLAQLLLDIDQNENTIRVTEHELISLEQSTQQTNVLANNIRGQVRKEREVLNLATTESRNIELEAKRIQQSWSQLTKNYEIQKKRLEDQNNDLERLQRMYEDEQKFVNVMEKMVETQLEDHSILEKYSHQDNLTIKDLELKLARAKEDMDDIDRQFRLAKEDRETTAIQLHKMQEEFRAMLEDRDQSLKQWETTVSQADNCRKQLEKSRADYQAIKQLANEDQNRLDGINRCVKQFQDDINSLERAHHAREVLANQMKNKIDDIEKIHSEQQAEYVAFEKVTKRLTTEIMASRKAVENQKKKAVEVQEKLVEAQAKHKQSELELEEFRNTVNSANAQKASLTSLSKAADERLTRQRNHLNDIANEFVSAQNEVTKMKTKLASCVTNTKCSIHSLRNLENVMTTLKQKLAQQEEAVYKKSMEIVRLELDLRRLRHSDGELEERRAQRQQIEILKADLDSANAHMVALKKELSKTQSDALGLQRTCDIQQQKRNVMKCLSKQLESECQSRERESQVLRRELEEIRMGESLIHLEIKRRESMLQTRSTIVQHLQNQKKNIENAIQTRLEELANQMELLQLEHRSLKERNQQLLLSVNQKTVELEHIKIRYNLVADTLVMENGLQETSEAYFIIKMAQEKEFLKESINDLEMIVFNLENENSALNNTLQLVSSCNQQFRQRVIVGVLSDDNKALKTNMETENQSLEKMIEELRREVYQQCHMYERLDGELRQLKEDAYRFKGIIDEKGLARKDVIDETEKLKSKIERAKEINLLLQKNAQRAKKSKSKLCEEIDFEILQMQEKLSSAQASMISVAEIDSEAKATLSKLLNESNNGENRDSKEIILPAIPKTRLEITDFPLNSTISTTISSPPSSGPGAK